LSIKDPIYSRVSLSFGVIMDFVRRCSSSFITALVLRN